MSACRRCQERGQTWAVVLGWYKRRGRTEYAGWLDDHACTALTLEQAESVLDMLAPTGAVLEAAP